MKALDGCRGRLNLAGHSTQLIFSEDKWREGNCQEVLGKNALDS